MDLLGDESKTTQHEGNTLLHLAVKSGNVNSTILLVERGADINATNQEGTIPFCVPLVDVP